MSSGLRGTSHRGPQGPPTGCSPYPHTQPLGKHHLEPLALGASAPTRSRAWLPASALPPGGQLSALQQRALLPLGALHAAGGRSGNTAWLPTGGPPAEARRLGDLSGCRRGRPPRWGTGAKRCRPPPPPSPRVQPVFFIWGLRCSGDAASSPGQTQERGAPAPIRPAGPVPPHPRPRPGLPRPLQGTNEHSDPALQGSVTPPLVPGAGGGGGRTPAALCGPRFLQEATPPGPEPRPHLPPQPREAPRSRPGRPGLAHLATPTPLGWGRLRRSLPRRSLPCPQGLGTNGPPLSASLVGRLAPVEADPHPPPAQFAAAGLPGPREPAGLETSSGPWGSSHIGPQGPCASGSPFLFLGQAGRSSVRPACCRSFPGSLHPDLASPRPETPSCLGGYMSRFPGEGARGWGPARQALAQAPGRR